MIKRFKLPDWIACKPQKTRRRLTTRSTRKMTMLSAATDVLRRASDKDLVESDIKEVGKYVRGELFTRTIFVFDNKQLDEGGKLHKDYLKNCRSLLANGKLADLDDETVAQYMNIVWSIMKKEGRYKAWLARKRSNAYQATQNSFMSKLVLVSETGSHLLAWLWTFLLSFAV